LVGTVAQLKRRVASRAIPSLRSNPKRRIED
jgi:hypothetical protein